MQTTAPQNDRIAFDLCKAYPMGGGRLLLHNTRNGQRAVVTREVYSTLLACVEFRTLDQHVVRIIRMNPGMRGQEAEIQKVLGTMLNDGIMISAQGLSEDLKRGGSTRNIEETGGLPVVVVITWERPVALERLLDSITANCNSGNFLGLFVVDDSRNKDNIAQNQALSDKFKSRLDCPVQYIGRLQQQDLIEKLITRLPGDEEAVRFLIDQQRWDGHWTAGLSRNLALLLSGGHRLVMIDDDAVCDVYHPAQRSPDIHFSDHPRDADFFSNEQDWSSFRAPTEHDPVERHMQCLGLTFSEALEVLGKENLGAGGFDNATALISSELSVESRVLMTECGSLGCPGTSNNTWLPDMSRTSLLRMLDSKEKTHNALYRRMVWSGRRQPHFAPRPNMSQITGFDNRRLLPPYLPILRGQDRLFGLMLDFIFPHGLTLDYPWAIPHLPVPERQWQEKDRDFTPGNSFPLFFFEHLLEHKSACLANGPDSRLVSLAAWFDDLSTASTTTLTAMHRDTVLRNSTDVLQHLAGLHAASESAPSEWQNYLTNGMAQINTGLDLVSRKDFRLRGFPEFLEGPDLVSFWKNTWGGYATAMRAWPRIRRAAAEIHEN
jgi:hypothetical protein